MYFLVPKERHVRKESNGRTLRLCGVPKESHDCIHLYNSLFQMRVMNAVLVRHYPKEPLIEFKVGRKGLSFYNSGNC